MKIKRTKTGTKSESKHEIVKSEQNGVSADESLPLISGSKKLPNTSGVIIPASPSASTSKRGNNSHRKDKVFSQVLVL